VCAVSSPVAWVSRDSSSAGASSSALTAQDADAPFVFCSLDQQVTRAGGIERLTVRSRFLRGRGLVTRSVMLIITEPCSGPEHRRLRRQHCRHTSGLSSH
jgi:hypothetical protein